MKYHVHVWRPRHRTKFGTHKIDTDTRVVSLGVLMVRYWKSA